MLRAGYRSLMGLQATTGKVHPINVKGLVETQKTLKRSHRGGKSIHSDCHYEEPISADTLHAAGHLYDLVNNYNLPYTPFRKSPEERIGVPQYKL